MQPIQIRTIDNKSRNISVPDIATKQLAFNCVDGKRRVRLSSNLLDLMGFTAGSGIVLRPEQNLSGFSVSLDPSAATHKVYQRQYKRDGRSNNPFETVMEFASQGFIDRCFPRYTERMHIEMRPGMVRFTPMANRAFAIAERFKRCSPYRAFVALTGGIDIHCMESLGWHAEIVLEHRPAEARDIKTGRNLSEVHALNTLINGSPRILLNEDIHHLQLDWLAGLLSDYPPIGLAHYSLGCDDHSNAKDPKAKARACDELSTMVDMVYPALKQIEVIRPAIVFVENVPNFKASGAGLMMSTSLRRMGYFVTEMILHGLDAGSTQGRERYYLVASVYPGFEAPSPVPRSTSLLWPLIEKHLHECKDVTDTSYIQARATSTRGMPPYLTPESVYCPTILKSQDRGIKDGVYIQHEGRVYKPSIPLLQKLMSIPDDVDVSWMAKEQATETLGQSIDYRLHHSVMAAVKAHLDANCGHHTMIRHGLRK